MSEFAMADLTGGQMNAIVKKLGGHQGAMQFLRGNSEVVVKIHVIDLDKDPLIPVNGWKVEEHKKGGQLTWDPTKLTFHFSSGQQNGKTIKGHALRKELAALPIMNANLLDYLLDHPHLIPEEWKIDEQGRTRFVYFWGTIYRDSGVSLCVRCLCWREGHWQADYAWLDSGWGDQSPALLASEELGAHT